MKRFFVLASVLLSLNSFSQNTFKAIVKEKDSDKILTGASLQFEGTNFGGFADSNGSIVILNIPDGKYILNISFLGYASFIDSIEFPLKDNEAKTYFLESEGDEMEAVIISTTRSSRTVKDIPTRVEFIAGEELDEKANMKPGDIRMMLNESTGILVQQTSATSANASIRIQGLDGRYTQILKDGFPLYSGFAGGLSLLQTPPLDLKQVELIKGSASTLYGGGAIAGLVNLISKEPTDKKELKLLINGTSAMGLDLNSFFAKRYDKMGITLLATRNSNKAYDPANVGFSAIPKFERYTLNPRLFYYFNENTKLNFGINSTWEERLGGDMKYINGDRDTSNNYFEKNNTKRIATQMSFEHKINENKSLKLKNSISYFERQIAIPGYLFDGIQYNTFTEMNYVVNTKKAEWIGGLNLWTEDFTEKKVDTLPLRNYTQNTFGLFFQNIFKATSKLTVESGLRADYVNEYGLIFLPRVSCLFVINQSLNSRLGGGFGYKSPTIFTEESERLQFRKALPIDSKTNTLEKSYGANWDITYRCSFADEKISFNLNHLFFYTRLNNPLKLIALTNEMWQFQNLSAHFETKGMETNMKFGYQDYKLFLGYTYTDIKIISGTSEARNPLTPEHRINAVLMYEVEEKWKLGLEAYYFSEQYLSDGTTGKDFWIMGFMAERLWENFSLYINFENFLDARQTKFGTIYTGARNNPNFKEIYAPLDGFVINGGLKIRL